MQLRSDIMINPMICARSTCALLVRVLTSVSFLTLTGCSFITGHVTEYCNSRAYVQIPLGDHLTSRFDSGAPVRLGILPFSVPANLAPRTGNNHTVSNELAWKVHAEMLAQGAVPIVEVLNREDWPGKRDEFFAGNFGALSVAREAGYDLVFVGYVEPMSSLDAVTAQGKLIETESGITLWYGTTTAISARPNVRNNLSYAWITNQRPDLLSQPELFAKLAECMVMEATSDNMTP